jgi:aminopeptidase YwaD
VNLLLVTAGQPDSFPLFIIAQVLGWPAVICFVCLLFNKVGNTSVGAGDNATGMVIVLELARYFKERGGLDHFETIFATFSAEEVGIVGSVYWIQKYASDMNPATSFMFNFDMVGKPGLQYMRYFGFARKPTNRKLNSLVTSVAKDLNIPITDFFIPVGAMTDRFPFAKRGWESVDFITRALSLQAHTPRDTMANIDGEVLVQACEVARVSAEKIDKGQI